MSMKKLATKVGLGMFILGMVMVLGSLAWALVADTMRAYVPYTLAFTGMAGIFMALFGGVMAWGMEAE